MDPEVDRMGADAVRALSKATALFIESLAAKSLAHAQQSKRKNFKFADIEAVAKRDRRLNDMGLADFFKNDRAFEGVHAARQDAENEGKAGGRGRPKKDGAAQEEEAQKAMRPLTDFFAVGSGSRGGGGVDEDAGQEEL